MGQTLELVIAADHSDLERSRTAVTQLGGRITPVYPANWHTVLSGILGGTGNLAADIDWIVLADSAAPLATADFRIITTGLETASSPVWLQPWNQLSVNDLTWSDLWGDCGPRVAALWNNPTSKYAVCLNRSVLRPIDFRTDSTGPSGTIWDALVRLVLQGQNVDFPHSPRSDKNQLTLPTKELPRLCPRPADSSPDWLKSRISALKLTQLVPGKKSDADAVAVKSGLCQWHGWLDTSHQLAQSIEGLGLHQAGDYWHAIHHRREPDFSNAKYWFRQLGSHSIFQQLATAATSILQSVPNGKDWEKKLSSGTTWDPYAFVDMCQVAAEDEATPLAIAARRLQAVEMRQLMISTWKDATGT